PRRARRWTIFRASSTARAGGRARLPRRLLIDDVALDRRVVGTAVAARAARRVAPARGARVLAALARAGRARRGAGGRRGPRAEIGRDLLVRDGAAEVERLVHRGTVALARGVVAGGDR